MLTVALPFFASWVPYSQIEAGLSIFSVINIKFVEWKKWPLFFWTCIAKKCWLLKKILENFINFRIFFLGSVYFFKGKGFWKFDDPKMRVANERQILSAPVWMGCPKALKSSSENDTFSGQLGAQNLSENGVFSLPVCVALVVCAVLVLATAVVVTVARKRKTHSYLRPKNLIR